MSSGGATDRDDAVAVVRPGSVRLLKASFGHVDPNSTNPSYRTIDFDRKSNEKVTECQAPVHRSFHR